MTATVYGIDLGTSGVKLSILSEDGDVITTASVAYPTTSPLPGHQEQAPSDWWSAFTEVLATGLARDVGAPSAFGLTGQMHSLVALSSDLEVVRPAILWSDTRSVRECQHAAERFDFEAVTGNPILPAFTLAHLLWVRAHEPAHYRRIAHVLLSKDYLRLRLSGALLTDASDASGTAMFDLARVQWSAAVLEAFDVPRAWLATDAPSAEITSEVASDIAESLGIGLIPVVTGAGDQAAQAIGMGVTEPGVLGVSLGTSGVITMAATAPVTGSFCHALPGRWLRLESMHTAGSSLTWFRDAIAPGSSIEDLLLEAAQAPAASGGLLFLPFLLGDRRSHDDVLSAAFTGLTMAHGRDHLVRSILEGVAFEIRRMAERWQRDGEAITEVRLAGGGARSRLWQQILADVLGSPVGHTRHGASGGAARLAAAALGWTSITTPIEVTESATPDPANVAAYDDAFARYRAAVERREWNEEVAAQ